MNNISAQYHQDASIHAKHMARSGSFQTQDIDIAIERITGLFGPHNIKPVGRGKKIQFEHSYAWIADICINWLAYGRELSNSIGEFSDENYCLMLPVGGHYSIEAGGKRVEGGSDSLTVINPTCPVTLEASHDYRNISVRITRSAIDRVLVQHLGERPNSPLTFACHPQVLKDSTESLKNMILQVWRECHQRKSLSTYEAVGRELEGLFASMLLLNVPNNYTDKLTKIHELKPSVGCRATANYLKENATENIHLDDIVQASGLTKTSLYTEFKKYYGMTPMEFLRVERLRLAYETLASATASSISVTNVAIDSGFTHFSRFANYYKKQFGELPSQTLQRHRQKFQ